MDNVSGVVISSIVNVVLAVLLISLIVIEKRKNKGEPGVPGEKGPEGPAGAQGVEGVKGLQGVEGVKGLQGIEGVEGLAGLAGTAVELPPGARRRLDSVDDLLARVTVLEGIPMPEKGDPGPAGDPANWQVNDHQNLVEWCQYIEERIKRVEKRAGMSV